MDSLYPPIAPRSSKASLCAFAILLTGVITAVFLAGGPQEGGPGIFLLLAGLALLIGPPQVRVEGRLWALLAGLLFFSALSLLPQGWFPVAEWRQHLKGLPIPVGTHLTPVPGETAFYLALLGITGVLFLFGLTHPLRSRVLLGGATGGVLLCLVYASLAIFSEKTGWKYPFDGAATFGFFPNRNHTATLLVTGSLLALGVLGVAGPNRKWAHGLIAATGLAVCVTALMIYSASRGGVVFLIIGTLLWLLGLGHSRWSKPLVISFAGIFLAGMILFLVSKGEARNRLLQQVGSIPAPAGTEAGAPGPLGADLPKEQEITLDARILIYKDTWRMIRQYPITGVGLGAFRYVYHHYRQASLTESTSVHPESDWLMLAAEAGIPSLLLVMTGGAILLARLRAQKGHPYWPLRWGVVCAALAAILHGTVDVPAHRPALGWWILVVAVAGLQIFPTKESRPRLWERSIFWVAGLGALAMGLFLIRAEWFNGPSSPPFAAKKAEKRILDLYEGNALEKASELATQEIAKSPMADGLYFQKGVLELHFEETEAEVDAFFAAQRALNPDWPQVPVQQGAAWINIDTTRSAALWLDAIARMQKIDQANGKGQKGTPGLYENLLRQSEKFPDLQRRLSVAADQNRAMTFVWLRMASSALVTEEIPKICQNTPFMATWEPDERQYFLKIWYEKGDRTSLFQFATQHPDWEEAIASLEIRKLIDAGKFQEAVQTVAAQHHLDLSLPSPGMPKTFFIPEESENLLANFEHFWKAGNEVTARRIIEEARMKAEKSGRPFPEIWKKSAALAMREGRWEMAWRYLQRYLRESGLDSSL